MKKPIIQFEDFSFQYDAQAAPTLLNINVTIYEGEKVLIVGPSGSGKSTLSNCLNGLVPFFYKGTMKGSLRINGKETKNESIFSLSKEVGTVLQDPDGQFIGLTVAEDIAFKMENECRVQSEMKTRVEAVAELVGIDSHLKSAPHALSGGQKQRVTLAGVMVDHVPILLFDEPLANLDPATGENAIELIDRIHEEMNKTTIIIEHRLEDVLYRHIDRIIVMNDGQIIADTTPNELLSGNTLKESGIREPLYVTALKYANCSLDENMGLEHIETIQLENCKEQLHQWFCEGEASSTLEEKEPVLELRDVHFSYEQGKEIIKGVSFAIKKGEMVSIVGKNGAGKSTLSRLICGFYRPTVGDILLNGVNLKGATIKERAQQIGYVMQNPNQMISKTMIFEEVALGLRIQGVNEDEIKQRVEATLKVCGLYPFRNWPISALSFGQKKRVTIASILVMNPSVIILDEPTAGQDFKHYTEIMEFLVQLNKQGVTIVFITHDMHVMLEYTKRAIVLADGQKVAEGDVTEILGNQHIIERAHLKETSLYQLAERLDFPSPRAFVDRFIQHDKEVRQS